ncbi:MAG: pyridoxamine 5'-phosphate oxidase family protein [Firmicutes bacterium]|nr:pyridoxamine 5'-phosphate oxidase family protein [Bacillota bacterium]
MLTTGGDVELTLQHPEALTLLPGTYGERLLETLQDAAADQPRFKLILPGADGTDRILDFIKKCGVFFLATVDGDQARVRPFGAIDRFEGRLYLQTGRIKNVFRQLEAGNRIELCCLSPDGTSWLRLAAAAVRDDRVEARQHMLDANPVLKSMYAADDGNCEVFYLTDGEAVFSSFNGSPEILRF